MDKGLRAVYDLEHETIHKASGTGFFLFINDVTGGKSSRVYSEVYVVILSARI